MKQSFYSNGKLLLTGEYVVLDGALALALPTKFGQYLHVESQLAKRISWTSYDNDKSVWFTADFSFEDIITKKQFEHNASVKNVLVAILHEAYQLNPSFLNIDTGYTITTELTFPRLWGLGTSSTLLNNISCWLNIDSFTLLRNSFGGSGYDIACAQNDTAILYQLQNEKPIITPFGFQPLFKDHLFFIYLNKKQSSKVAIANYLNKQPQIAKTVTDISQITETLLETKNVEVFSRLLENHEILLSKALELPTVKETLFPDFHGVLKSLGAWGGDFILAVSQHNPTDYFVKKGYSTVLAYQDMIK